MPLLDDAPVPTEADRVIGWRLHVLIEAGYPIALAEQLAFADHVDLHQAVQLIIFGCKHVSPLES